MSLIRGTFAVMTAVLAMGSFAQAAGFVTEAAKIPTYRGQHAFCFREEDSDKVSGQNLDEQMRLASTTKLITSLWAIDTLGADFRFTTNMIYKPSTQELYIQGEGDPYFGRKKIYALMSELIKNKITSIRKIHFSKSLVYNRDIDCGDTYAECKNEATLEWMTRGGIPMWAQLNGIKSAMNPARWSAGERNDYINTVNLAKKRGLQMLAVNQVKFQVGEVVSVEVNPFADELRSHPANFVSFQSKSAPIFRYLKHMNVNSMNWVADVIFANLGGASAWAKYAQDNFNFNSDVMKIYVGSGLNVGDSYPARKDGYATCPAMLEIMSTLDKKLESTSPYRIEDLMMVSGVDNGTLSGAYSAELLSKAVIAKTGTLYNAISLAGLVRTKQGVVFFGMFFHTQAQSAARAAGARVIEKLVKDFGGADRTNWKPDGPFLSFDKELALRQVPSLDLQLK